MNTEARAGSKPPEKLRFYHAGAGRPGGRNYLARATGICLLATLKAELGTLSRVRRIVKVLGMVNSAPTFTEHPKVMNGFSDLMVAVFGERGKHARSSVGVAALPGDMAVEIEMIVEVE